MGRKGAVETEMILLSAWLCLQGDDSLLHPAVRVLQGAELPAEAVSGLPGGAGDPAGVGERGAAAADLQPGAPLFLQPVSLRSSPRCSFLYLIHLRTTSRPDGGG